MICRLLTCCLFALPALLQAGEKDKPIETKGGYKQIDSFNMDDFSWVPRTLKKAPAFKSDKVRYNYWVLGKSRDAAMVMAWDESKGTGTGYDTVYFDKNFNGDLTEEGEKLQHPIPTQTGKKAPTVVYELNGIKDASGKSYRMVMKMNKGKYSWKSGFFISLPNPDNSKRPHGYRVGLLPGNLQIKYANTLKDAPIYRLGSGNAMVLPSKRIMEGRRKKYITLKPGDHYGTFAIGQKAKISLVVAEVGADLSSQLRFHHAKVGRKLPRILLRVLKDGKSLEDIPFRGGCG